MDRLRFLCSFGKTHWNEKSLLFGSASDCGTGAASWDFIGFRNDAPTVLLEDVYMDLTFFKEVGSIDVLQDMQHDRSASYVLTSDIDASETHSWNDGAGFIPVGDDDEPFAETFDCRGHEIVNLYINALETEHVGLFGQISASAKIENHRLSDVSIAGRHHVGAATDV